MRTPQEMRLGEISAELRSLGWSLEIELRPSPNEPDLPRWIRHESPFGVSYPQVGGTLEAWYQDALTRAREGAQ